MSGRIEISLSDLRDVTNRLLNHLEEVEGDSVALERDYFWSVPAPGVYNVYSKPDDLTVGQLSECWVSLQQLLADGGDVSYALVWLADILRAIGEDIVR